MLTDTLWSIVFLFCIGLSLRSPYLALYTLLFADILKPQNLSYSFLAGQSVSLALTAVLLASMIINMNKLKRPKVIGVTVVLIMFMAWITYTTTIAQFQGPAWFKYDYVIKTIVVTLFIPFILDSRLKIEIVLAAIVCGVAYYILMGGIRTALGQASYTTLLVPTAIGDSEITETSTLSMIAVFTIPILIYIKNNSLFKDRIPFLKTIIYIMIICCIFTVIGTYARTGLVGLAFLFFLYLMSSKYKIQIALAAILLGVSLLLFAPADYTQRMSTLENATEESSALGRILVWRWTLDYVSERPITGGGFDSYIANAGQLNRYLESDVSVNLSPNRPKAYHNIFFEVLGEQGYVGLAMYLGLIFLCWNMNRKLKNDNQNEEYLKALAKTLNYVIMIYSLCGLFIGIAYAPWIFYFIGLSVSLQNLLTTQKSRYKRSKALQYASNSGLRSNGTKSFEPRA